MLVLETVSEVRRALERLRLDGKRIGFVPTMGYLHSGHLSLVERSRANADFTVMSIFVNPIQFDNPDDLKSYPRERERDLRLAEEAGVDIVFAPSEDEMYRDGRTTVDMTGLTDYLCGAHRPGHFRGVFTVVAKLFNIVNPDIAVFGQKDIQQALSIRKMTLDLNFPVEIIIAPIVREEEGLAMSSRNKHLDTSQRKAAFSLYSSLKKAEAMLKAGNRSWQEVRAEMENIIGMSHPESIEYISAVDYETLAPVDSFNGKTVVALAVYFGSTRLIDNMIVSVEGEKTQCVF